MATSTSTQPQQEGSWFALCRDKFGDTFPSTFNWKDQQKDLTQTFQDTIGSFHDKKEVQKTDFQNLGFKEVTKFDDQEKIRDENMKKLKDAKQKVTMPDQSYFTREGKGKKDIAMGDFMRDYIQKTFPKIGELPAFSVANGNYTFGHSLVAPFAKFLDGFTNYNMAESSTAGPMLWTEEKLLSMLAELSFCKLDDPQETIKHRKGDASGYFTMGGTFNLLQATRLAMLKAFGTSFKQRGFEGVFKQMLAQQRSSSKLPDIKIFCSANSHSCVEKVCDYMGLGTNSIVFVNTKRVGKKVVDKTKIKLGGDEFKNEDDEQNKRDWKGMESKKGKSAKEDPFEFEMDYYDLEVKLRRCLNRNDIVPMIVATQGTTERFCGDDVERIRTICDRLKKTFGSTRMPMDPVIFNDASIGFEWLLFKDYDFEKNELSIPEDRSNDIRRICNRISNSCENSDVVGFNFHKAGLCAPNSGAVLFKDKKDFYLTRSFQPRQKSKLNNEKQTISENSMNNMAYDPNSLNLEYSRSTYGPMVLDMLFQFYGKQGIRALQVMGMEILEIIRNKLIETKRFHILNTGDFNNTLIIRAYPSKLCKDQKDLSKLHNIELTNQEESENLVKEINKYQIKLIERIKERNIVRKQQGLPCFDCSLISEFGLTEYGQHFPVMTCIKFVPNSISGCNWERKDFENSIKENYIQPLMECVQDL